MPINEEDRQHVLALLAPGAELREGIEGIIRASCGALIVIGSTPEVEPLVSGGFVIDIAATSQRIAELAKMDGALVLDAGATRVLRANVDLVPDPSILTRETGTRHRSAERTAKQTGQAVIAVSSAFGGVTVYHGDTKRTLEEVSALLVRANQALSTLERYRSRLDEVSSALSAREVEDAVTVRDVVLALQRAEMMRRIAGEVADHVIELGTEGRLIQLQLDELVSSVADVRGLVVRDYLGDQRRKPSRALGDVAALTTNELLDAERVATTLAYHAEQLGRPVMPRGYRLLSQIPRLPTSVVERLVAHFGTLPRIMGASPSELDDVEEVGESRARAIHEGLRRLAEASLLDRSV